MIRGDDPYSLTVIRRGRNGGDTSGWVGVIVDMVTSLHQGRRAPLAMDLRLCEAGSFFFVRSTRGDKRPWLWTSASARRGTLSSFALPGATGAGTRGDKCPWPWTSGSAIALNPPSPYGH